MSSTKDDQHTISTQITVNSDSPWFSGHFPDNPILPGIAQLKMVADVIAFSRKENLCIKQLSRVKFKKIVRPGDKLEIHTAVGPATDTFTFRITSEAQDVCSGTMTLFAKSAAK